MDNVIFVDFQNKERITIREGRHLFGLLISICNAKSLLGSEFINEQLRTILSIKD